jgi:hypothetical protein
MNQSFFDPVVWLIELLSAVTVVLLAAHSCRTNPEGLIARLLRHPDRIWFALLVLLIPATVSPFYFFNPLMRHLAGGRGMVPPVAVFIYSAFAGECYGLAACWFASPGKREERFSRGMALLVAVALVILISTLTQMFRPFRPAQAMSVPVILDVGVILAWVVARAFAGKDSRPDAARPPVPGTAGGPDKKTHDRPLAILWLPVGLVPIPVLLVMFSLNSKPSSWAVVVVLVACVACHLLGGFGCVGGIKNTAVRIILGIFLALFFFLLTAVVVLFQACSHMNI